MNLARRTRGRCVLCHSPRQRSLWPMCPPRCHHPTRASSCGASGRTWAPAAWAAPAAAAAAAVASGSPAAAAVAAVSLRLPRHRCSAPPRRRSWREQGPTYSDDNTTFRRCTDEADHADAVRQTHTEPQSALLAAKELDKRCSLCTLRLHLPSLHSSTPARSPPSLRRRRRRRCPVAALTSRPPCRPSRVSTSRTCRTAPNDPLRERQSPSPCRRPGLQQQGQGQRQRSGSR